MPSFSPRKVPRSSLASTLEFQQARLRLTVVYQYRRKALKRSCEANPSIWRRRTGCSWGRRCWWFPQEDYWCHYPVSFSFALRLTWHLGLYCSSAESTARSTILWITVSNIGAIIYVSWAYYYEAGFTFDKMLHNMPDDAFDIIQKIHVRAPFRLIRQAAPYFRVKVLVILFLIQIVTSTYRMETTRTAQLSTYHPPQASMAMSVKPTMPLLNHPSSVLPKPLLKNGVPSVSVPTP